ncbi:Zinc finger protein [Plakobranchus ocellatus]|uniref:Zinc finger protein n=1 Tax=Plakobranchus ocellatus TaxID=259542 RepID=A0AAV4CWN0_9GAST|nr:Zinc finger protein [Plakobranchus ocellatus]
MKLVAEMKLLQAKMEAGIIKNDPDGSGARSNDAGAKHPKLTNFQDGRDDLDIWLTSEVEGGMLKLASGKSVPVMTKCAALRDPEKTRSLGLPVLKGEIGGREVDVMRDTGCEGVVVRKQLVDASQLTGECCLLLRVDNTALLAEKAVISLRTPFLSGEVKALCIPDAICDVIVGNDTSQATTEKRPPTSSLATPAASVTVIEDLEGEHFNDSDCEALPELGGWGSKETVNDLKYGDGLTLDQRKQLEEVAVTYSSIFSDRPGTASTEEHCIELTSSIPVRQRPYPVPKDAIRDDEFRGHADSCCEEAAVWNGQRGLLTFQDSLGRGAIGLQDENVEKVRNAPRPKTKREVRAFLGLVGYYKEFVPNFAAVSAPLSDLVRKGQPNIVNWGDSQERAYNSLKIAVTSKPVLQLPDVNKRFVLRTDASDRGLGAALMQESEGTLFPVAYASKKLTDRERKYSVTEREALAIVWGVKKFSLYLYGTVFTLQTDHGALQFLNAAKFDSPRVMRWALALQVYNFDVQYIKGSENVGADYLSRIE